jgi:hypothetical protein
MKKILTILGVIFICLIVAGAIVFSGLHYYAKELDKEAKAYIDEVIPSIATSWNSKELINYASPEFLQAVPAKKIELLFDAFSEQMGPLKDYKGATGRVKIRISPRGKPIIKADYLAEAVFEKAPAKIQVQMIRRNHKWEIVGFLVKLRVKP